MNAKHTYATPGPWFDTGEIDKRPSKDGWLYTTIVADEKSEMPCVAIAYGETKDECQANARLIAAAPDLLAALQEMMRQFEPADPGNDDGINDCDAIVLARAAIRKAQGGAE